MRTLLLLLLAVSTPAAAGEAFAGLALHGRNLGFVTRSYERGVDLVAGVRSAPLARALGAEVRAHGLASINLDGGTDFAAAGASLRWGLGDGFYIQPGLGIAGHDGSNAQFQRRPDRLYLGSRVLFEPELTLGARLSQRWAAEIAYVHLSHAQLAGRQNPGLDTLGVRLVRRF